MAQEADEAAPDRSAVQLIDHVAQVNRGVFDVGVLVASRPYLRGEYPASVHLPEVAVWVLVPGLGVLGCLVIDAEVPVHVFVPAIGLDESVFLAGRGRGAASG